LGEDESEMENSIQEIPKEKNEVPGSPKRKDSGLISAKGRMEEQEPTYSFGSSDPLLSLRRGSNQETQLLPRKEEDPNHQELSDWISKSGSLILKPGCSVVSEQSGEANTPRS
jgi:hypothetical protein